MKNFLLVFLGGGAGSVLRYLAGIFIPYKAGIPVATLTVNILGSFLIGLLTAMFSAGTDFDKQGNYLLVVGFCGGFTTFSAFSKESFVMIQQQQWNLLILYILSSLILCIAATAAGFFLFK